MASRLIQRPGWDFYGCPGRVVAAEAHVADTAMQGSLSAGHQFTLAARPPARRAVVHYTWRLFLLVRGKLLWKIRRRLILAHVFIGAIPVLLIIFITYVSLLLFYYQLTYY